jgi:hypothetical protein
LISNPDLLVSSDRVSAGLGDVGSEAIAFCQDLLPDFDI